MPARPILNDFWRDLLAILSIAISLVGFVLTVISLAYAIIQIRKTKTAAEAALDAADRSLRESHRHFQRFAVSISSRFVSEVRLFLDQESWNQAALRLGDIADQAAQLAKADAGWETLLTELRAWEISVRRVSKGEIKFPQPKWERFLGQLQRKIDELHGPFDRIEEVPNDSPR